MIIDVTGVILTPGNEGSECLGNWEGEQCCCEECDYMMCCYENNDYIKCQDCEDKNCPRKN